MLLRCLSVHVSRAMQVKQRAKEAQQSQERLNEFQGVSLEELPDEAKPLSGKEYKGKKGYTIHGPSGAVTLIKICVLAVFTYRCVAHCPRLFF